MKLPSPGAMLSIALTLAAGHAMPAPVERADNSGIGLQFPLEHPDRIDFTVEEGTWLSLDLSPDGKTLLFELLGELYTLPVAGGEARLFMGGPSYNGMARYSPDGKSIVFVSDRSGSVNLWLCDANGSNLKALTNERDASFTSPSWTPDGRHVVSAKGWVGRDNLPTEIHLYDIGGESDRTLAHTEFEALTGAIVSPDGRFVYYAKAQDGPQIFRLDLSSGETLQVTDRPAGAMRPGLTPDGKTLLYFTTFHDRGALRARDVASGAERWLAYPLDRNPQGTIPVRDTLPGYAITADGKEIFSAQRGKIHRIDLASGKATPLEFVVKVSKRVHPPIHFEYRVDDTPQVTARFIRGPRLSPDGRRVVFGAFNRLYIETLGAGTPRRLTRDEVGEFSPSWSPDGRWIVYATYSRQGGAIRRISVSGEQSQVLAQGNQYDQPLVTPDGENVVFLDRRHVTEEHAYFAESGEHSLPSAYATTVDIVSVAATGGKVRSILRNTRALGAQFIKGSQRLYFHEGFGGNGLSSVRLDGLELHQHLQMTGPPAQPGGMPTTADSVRLSPDGSFAFVKMSDDERLHVFALPQLDAPLQISLPGPDVPHRVVTDEGGEDLDWASDGTLTWASGRRFYRLKNFDLAAGELRPQVATLRVSLARAKPRGTLALRGARIVTMRGDEVIAQGDILIRDNRIVAVGPGAATELSKGAKVLDVSGTTISPGLVDVHNHWSAASYGSFGLPQSWGYLADLSYGLTTLRDPQSEDTRIFDHGDQIDIGAALGPRIYTTGRGLRYRRFASQEEVFKLIRKYKETYGVHTIKEYLSGDRRVRQWIALACRELQLTPTTEGKYQDFLALTETVDGYSGHEHGLPSPFYEDMVQLLVRTKTFYTPTITSYDNLTWHAQHADVAHDARTARFMPADVVDAFVRGKVFWQPAESYEAELFAAGAARVARAGGRVCLGAHGEFHGLGTHWELWNLALAMTPLEALRAATLSGAQAIGLARDIGSIEPGKLADLIVYDANPLDDIRNSTRIRFVVKNGEVFDSSTMDMLWPAARKLPRQLWQGTEPGVTTP